MLSKSSPSHYINIPFCSQSSQSLFHREQNQNKIYRKERISNSLKRKYQLHKRSLAILRNHRPLKLQNYSFSIFLWQQLGESLLIPIFSASGEGFPRRSHRRWGLVIVQVNLDLVDSLDPIKSSDDQFACCNQRPKQHEVLKGRIKEGLCRMETLSGPVLRNQVQKNYRKGLRAEYTYQELFP